MASALAEVIAVFEQGKPRIVRLDILKEFRGENNKRDSWTEENETLGTGGRQLARQKNRRLNRLTTRHRSHPAVKRQWGVHTPP